jgi:type II secretion system protein N
MSIKHYFFYLVYFVAALAVFSIICFPGEEAAKKIGTQLTERFPEITLQMEKITPSFPTGIHCINPQLLVGKNLLVPLETLTLRLPFFDLFKSDRTLTFHGTLLSGVVDGSLTKVSWKQNSFSDFNLTLNRIKTKNILYTTPQAKIEISFDLEGDYTFARGKERSGSRGKLVLTNVKAMIRDTLFNGMGIDGLEFTRMDIEFGLVKDKITLLNCLAKGPLMTLRLKGTLMAPEEGAPPGGNWILDLKGFIQPQPAYLPKFARLSSMASLFKDTKQGIPIHIIGPLNAPGIKL